MRQEIGGKNTPFFNTNNMKPEKSLSG